MAQKAFALALLPVGIGLCAPVLADDYLRYQVVRGDTLIEFGQKYLERPLDYRIVQRTNRITDPQTMPVGKILSIPRSLLKYDRAVARLATVRGDVLISPSATTQAKTGQTLVEGQAIQTGPGSSASLLLADGSRISLPSNSRLKIIRLRRYALESALDYDFEVQRGEARSRVVPHKSKNDRYQVRTPKAISAVRGTDFQTRYDETSGRDFAEVDDGALIVALPVGKETAVAAGNGLAVQPDGSSVAEAMLPAPELEGAGRLQKDSSVSFALPTAQAGAYRLAIAADSGFHDRVADLVAQGPLAEFGALADGNYFLRARAVSANGIEGLPATYAFKRRLNNIRAAAEASATGWVFKWDGEGQGLIRYQFQLHKGSTDAAPMVDELALEGRQIILSDLAPDNYFWRVGAVQYVDGESNTNWTPFEKFIVSAE
jgi:hypothetical protein